MSENQEPIIGIDLGTTFSLVAYCDASGPRVIRDADGDARVPSVLRFDEDGSVTIGWEAREQAVEYPRETVYSVKRLMGIGLDQLEREVPFLTYRVGHPADAVAAGVASAEDPANAGRDIVAVEINGRWLTPQEISALLLRELKTRAERHLGQPVRKAVVTVPAYFDDSQRQATRDAGRIAGLDVVRIVNEPTAAALAYGLGIRGSSASPQDPFRSTEVLPIGDKSKCTGASEAPADAGSSDDRMPAATIAVYDLGGGTFDVSVLRLEDGIFEVRSTQGDTHLGGDDFDREIVELVQGEIREQFGVDIESPRTRQALRLLAERVKVRLSDEEAVEFELELGKDRRYQRRLTRAEFEQRIEPLVDRTLACCRKALKDADLDAAQIEQVVLVGGCTRIPLVHRRVAETFGRSPYTALNPDEVVALGASVQAQVLAGGRRDLLLLDVTPLSLGVETMGGAMGKLIMANTRVPCQATEMFTTFVDGQVNVKFHVLQGERELAKDCRSLGQFELRGIPPMPSGIPKLEVSFLIDANGILNVSACEQRSGVEAGIQVVPAHGLTSDEVERMTLDGYQFAREDMGAHRLIDLRNQVSFDTHKTEQMLAKAGHTLDPASSARIQSNLAALRELAETCDDADTIQRALEAFDRDTLTLAERAIAEALKEHS
ncbi:MAG: Hsp70 family protein [Phycisphaerae bacterium]